jgi:glycosyltransferase involved in cell wall biosynthesis
MIQAHSNSEDKSAESLEGLRSCGMQSRGAQQICMLGAFPPPVHGMAWLNYAMREYLHSLGIKVHTVDLSAATLDRHWFARATRLKKVAGGLFQYARILFLYKVKILYLTLSGGYGQVFELLFVGLARLARVRMIIHHHSFAYLLHPSRLTFFLCRCSGPETLHVTGSAGMSELLHTIYGAKNLIDLSNAALVSQQFVCTPRVRSALRTIGFMGNISHEKGIGEFLEMAKLMEDLGIDVDAVIAGPFQDPAVEIFVRNKLSTLSRVEYVGAKYGPEKSAYFDTIDVLVFPSKYDNETDPVTVYEALASGVPVIAWDRGCLSNSIVATAGELVPRDRDFSPAAIAAIRRWRDSEEKFRGLSAGARSRFEDMASRSLAVLRKVASVSVCGSTEGNKEYSPHMLNAGKGSEV